MKGARHVVAMQETEAEIQYLVKSIREVGRTTATNYAMLNLAAGVCVMLVSMTVALTVWCTALVVVAGIAAYAVRDYHRDVTLPVGRLLAQYAYAEPSTAPSRRLWLRLAVLVGLVAAAVGAAALYPNDRALQVLLLAPALIGSLGYGVLDMPWRGQAAVVPGWKPDASPEVDESILRQTAVAIVSGTVVLMLGTVRIPREFLWMALLMALTLWTLSERIRTRRLYGVPSYVMMGMLQSALQRWHAAKTGEAAYVDGLECATLLLYDLVSKYRTTEETQDYELFLEQVEVVVRQADENAENVLPLFRRLADDTTLGVNAEVDA